MATKNNPGEFDCYEAADPDEPMFVMLGRDRRAPGRVRSWARRYWWCKIFPLLLRTSLPISDGPFSPTNERLISQWALLKKRQRKYREALTCANSMEAWERRLCRQAGARARRRMGWFVWD